MRTRPETTLGTRLGTITLALGLLCLAFPPLAAGPEADRAFDDLMAGLEGGWAGPENDTPMGRMPFSLVFDRTGEQELTALAALSRDTWIRMRFYREDGRWMLEQAASLEGLGQQSSVLVPDGKDGNLHRWVDPENPEYLRVEVGHDEPDLFIDVTLRGRPHARFQLQRVEGDALVALRQETKAGLERTKEDVSIYQFAGNGDVPEAIGVARRAVAAKPEDAGVRMELAQALIAQIQADQASAPLWAGELLTTLQKALELDPKRPDVYQGLIGYYLSAPPIAGGSVEKARELTERLQEIDPEAAKAMQAQMAQRGGGSH